MKNKDRGLTRELIERDIETNDYIQKLWSELSEEDKQLSEVILGYYVKKLQKKIHKKIKKRLELNERELNHKVFIKAFKKFFSRVHWDITLCGEDYVILNIKDNYITDFDIITNDFSIVNFNSIIIILLSKNLHKPHSEALQGTINEKV